MKRIVLLLLAAVMVALGADARTYALCTGVSNYKQRPGVPPLTQTTKDAKSFAQLLKTKYPDVSLITGDNATVNNVTQQLARLARAAGPDDQIIFFYSGHGAKGVFCLADKDMPYTDLLKIFSNTRCKNVVLIMDACFSGSYADAVQQLKSQNQFKGNVAAIVSSRGNETSIESPIVGAGFLAQGVIKAFRGKADANSDKKLTLSELFRYTYNDVTARAARIDHPQHPQLIAPAGMKELVVWNW